MAKDWRFFAHPDYIGSFREVVINPDERFKVTTGIREYLKSIEDPKENLTVVPGEIDQYEFEVLRFVVIVQWKEENPSDIRLLEIYESDPRN